MKRIQQGFTLIELMIVVAIVGILAAIALPAYQDYIIRSKMSEGVAAAAACKTSLSEYVATKNTWPADANNAGCSQTATQYVAGLNVAAANGEISVTTTNTGSKLGGAVGDCVLSLTPVPDNATTPTELLTWLGSHTACDSKYVPSNFR
jgi:type IV pilus assembly protein PilA